MIARIRGGYPMTKLLWGLVLIVLGVAAGGFALLMTFGSLLDSKPNSVNWAAMYACIFWLVCLSLVVSGVWLRRRAA
jgi:hypothetical protein